MDIRLLQMAFDCQIPDDDWSAFNSIYLKYISDKSNIYEVSFVLKHMYIETISWERGSKLT